MSWTARTTPNPQNEAMNFPPGIFEAKVAGVMQSFLIKFFETKNIATSRFSSWTIGSILVLRPSTPSPRSKKYPLTFRSTQWAAVRATYTVALRGDSESVTAAVTAMNTSVPWLFRDDQKILATQGSASLALRGETHTLKLSNKKNSEKSWAFCFSHFKPDEIRWALLAGVSAQWVIGNHTVDGCWELIDPVNSVMKYSLYTPWN